MTGESGGYPLCMIDMKDLWPEHGILIKAYRKYSFSRLAASFCVNIRAKALYSSVSMFLAPVGQMRIQRKQEMHRSAST